MQSKIATAGQITHGAWAETDVRNKVVPKQSAGWWASLVGRGQDWVGHHPRRNAWRGEEEERLW